MQRSFTYDAAGNTLDDTRVASGTATTYSAAYSQRNRLLSMTVGGLLKATYPGSCTRHEEIGVGRGAGR